MANSVVFRVREQTRGPVGGVIFLWATVQAVCWGLMVRTGHVFSSHLTRAEQVWFWSTIALGIILGIRRRVGTSFTAPLVAALFNVVPTYVGFLLSTKHGIIGGFLLATGYVVLGWVGLGALQAGLLFLSSVVTKLVLAPFRRTSEVTVIGPGESF